MTCFGLAGAFQHSDVSIGWYPGRATVSTEILSKPGGGHVVDALPAGDGFCRQSVRNPLCSATPSLRPAVLGSDGRRYVWGYRRDGSKTGWVRADHVERDPAAYRKREAKGPAGEDFEAGRGVPRRGLKSGCGKLSLSKPERRVKARDVHLRYSPHGTSFHYLHAGDVVRLLLVDGPQGYVFVQVIEADGSARSGVRGWVAATGLEAK